MLAVQDVALQEGEEGLHCGVVRAGTDAAPLPEEVLPLSAQDRAVEDALRWRKAHESTAQLLIASFDPRGAQVERWRTSLLHLARELDLDVESARAGVLTLLADGDFTATIDVERAAENKVFELVVDWEAFTADRVTIHLGGPDDEPDDP